jgi:hypothetical protein
MFVADSLTRLTSKDIGNSSFIFLIFCHSSQPCSLADETAAVRLFLGFIPENLLCLRLRAGVMLPLKQMRNIRIAIIIARNC